MTLEINEEAIAYIKGLSGQDVKRAFLLDYMLEKIEKSATVKTISFNGGTFKTDDKELIEALSTFPFFCQKTYSDSKAVILDKKSNMFDWYKGEFNNESAKPNISLEEKCDVCKTYPKIKNSNKCESCDSCIKHIVETSPEFAKYRAKPNYSDEEIEIVKSNIAERKVTEQASELLKFDQIDKDEIILSNVIEQSKGPRNTTVGELVKNSDYFKEKLEKAFDAGRRGLEAFTVLAEDQIFRTFEDYYKTLKKE